MAQELEYYKEQLAYGRHIEVQRSTIAGVAATASGAIIGKLLESLPLTRAKLPYTVALFFVGLTAFLFSAKLYERFKLHMEIAKLARNKLDPTLQVLRRKAERAIKTKYPILFCLPLHLLWNWFFVLIALGGAIATAYILCADSGPQFGINIGPE
jgi:hypothetical protein